MSFEVSEHSLPPRKKRFRQIYLEITNVCERACSFCPGTLRAQAFMDRFVFKRALSEIQLLAEQVYFHVMGEPLLHPQFGWMVEHCAELGMPVAITTNGLHLNERTEQALLNPIVRQVNFSLHGLDLGTADTATGIAGTELAVFERVLAFTLRALQEHPELYINFRFWSGHSVPEAVRERLATEGLIVPTEPWGQSLRLRGRLYLHTAAQFDWPGEAAESQQGSCRALATHCAILVDGSIVPCCLDRNGSMVLGNIVHDSLETVLDGPRASAMRSGFGRRELVEELCRHCGYCRRF